MTTNLIRQRHNSRKIANGPTSRRIHSQINHTTDERRKNQIHVLEVSHDSIEADSEAGFSKLLGGGCPGDVYAEEAGDVVSGGRGDWEGEAYWQKMALRRW